ncbi:MAG TPA: helix-turn-helix domain-containing protein [Thermodesulfobacteriota bacterium]
MVGKKVAAAGRRTTSAGGSPLVEALASFGFAEYDARVYGALLERQPATAYEAARGAGIPDSKIYRVLERLEARGLALRLPGEPATFAALPPEDLLGRLDARTRQSLQAVRRALEGLARREAPGGAWPLADGPAVLERAAALLAAAERHVEVACGGGPLAALAGAIAEARERGVAVSAASPSEVFLLVADGAEAIVARLDTVADGRVEGRGLASREPALLDLAAEALSRRRAEAPSPGRPDARSAANLASIEAALAPGRLDIC